VYARRARIRSLLSAIVAANLLLTSCATSAPFVVALPNGYYLLRDRATHVALVKRGGGTVVAGPIAAYAVAGNVVAGCVGGWQRQSFGYSNESPFPDSADCRYFILDTPTARMETDLAPEAWRARLETYGVSPKLEITAPVLPQ